MALRTPLRAGNLALFTNRWQLIEQETFPVYQRLIAEHAAEAHALITRPIAQRVGRFDCCATAVASSPGSSPIGASRSKAVPRRSWLSARDTYVVDALFSWDG